MAEPRQIGTKPTAMPVLVSNDFPPQHGGIQRCMFRIAQELSRTGRVTVVAPQVPSAREFDGAQRYRILRYPAVDRLSGLAGMTVWLLRARLASRDDYTLASMWFPAGLAACALPRALRGRLGILAHGTEIAPGRGGLRRAVMRWVFERADVVIANSRFTRDLLVRAGVRRHVDLMPLGTDASSITPARAAHPVILSVGRLIARKGFDRVIAALPSVLQRFPDARYEIVGDGPQRAELEALARTHDVAEHVVFHGALSDEALAAAYARAWCFALPVRANGDDVEGFGLVYLEAALAELPAIGGRHSGAEDAIVADQTGLLVDGESSPQIAAAIVRLLGDPATSAAMGRLGRERALREFTWSNCAAIIERLLNGQRSAPLDASPPRVDDRRAAR